MNAENWWYRETIAHRRSSRPNYRVMAFWIIAAVFFLIVFTLAIIGAASLIDAM